MENYSSSLLNLKKNPTANGYILDLKMTQISSLSSIFNTVRATDISELILSYNSFQLIDAFISDMINLQVLNISVNQIREITNLENLKKLESLNLSTNRIRNINNLQYLARLVRLDLSMNYICKIEGLNNLKLQILNLSSNNISVLENLETLQNLECLDISKNKLQNFGCLEKTPLKSLKRLLCSHNLFPNQYLDKFENTIISHKYIEELNCIGNEIVLCKEFVIKISKAPYLKILNGVPVFTNQQPLSRKPAEKQKSDIRIGSSLNISDIIDIGIKGSSLQDLRKKKEEINEKKEEKKEDFMDIINMYSIQKSQEKFKKNEEFIKKLKESKVETKPIRIPSPQMLKRDEIASSPKNSSSPSSNKKRPSIFSGKTIEDNRKPPLAIKEMERLALIAKQDRKSQTIDPQTASTMVMNYKPHLRIATNNNIIQRSSSNVRLDSSKEQELAVSENSKNSKQSKNISDRSFGSNEEISKPKKTVTSQRDLNKRVASTHHLTNISINSKISVNTDKLKERLEKFKENSTRRNSENLESKPVDWKEKRKQFLLKKQEKRQEEETLRKSLKPQNLFEEDAKEEEKTQNKNTSKACNIF